MNIALQPSLHLTYCLNVHPGDAWEQNLEAIRRVVLPLHDRLAPDVPFGLGLRLSHEAALTLSDPGRLEEFRDFLQRHNLYVFTVNAFPYGSFHGRRVKEDVYRPDWRTDERRDYTIRVADILAALLPPRMSGSISTAPGSYRTWIAGAPDVTAMVTRLMDVVAHLARLERRTGRHLHLGLEPEPDCFLETTRDVREFFAGPLNGEGARCLADAAGVSVAAARALIGRHLGVCFDTCHLALQFESLEESLRALSDAGIRISKIQVSSALRAADSAPARDELAAFCDPVYLHQVKTRTAAGAVRSRGDLADALQGPAGTAGEELRIHCHVPLYFTGRGALRSTASELTPAFFQAIRALEVEHLEIETYTFDVLPADLRAGGIEESLAREYRWLLEKLG